MAQGVHTLRLGPSLSLSCRKEKEKWIQKIEQPHIHPLDIPQDPTLERILLQCCKTLQGSRNNALRCTASLHHQTNLMHAYGQIDPCMAKFSPLPASGICPEGLSHAQGVGRAKYPLCNQWFDCSSNTRCPERSPGGRAEQSPESKGGYNGEEITAGQNMFQMLQRPKWVPKTCKEQNGSQSPQKPKWVPKAATTQ